jgi:hypothetical protein
LRSKGVLKLLQTTYPENVKPEEEEIEVVSAVSVIKALIIDS